MNTRTYLDYFDIVDLLLAQSPGQRIVPVWSRGARCARNGVRYRYSHRRVELQTARAEFVAVKERQRAVVRIGHLRYRNRHVIRTRPGRQYYGNIIHTGYALNVGRQTNARTETVGSGGELAEINREYIQVWLPRVKGGVKV